MVTEVALLATREPTRLVDDQALRAVGGEGVAEHGGLEGQDARQVMGQGDGDDEGDQEVRERVEER
jgi:hypothetical protein